MPLYTPEELRKKLPKVGDVMVKAPVSGKYLGICSAKPRKGVVTCVNEKNIWYTLQFDSGYSEVFYLPDIDNYAPPAVYTNLKRKVKCIETGKVYNSLSEAASDAKCLASSISNTCRGRTPSAGGFRWKYMED